MIRVGIAPGLRGRLRPPAGARLETALAQGDGS